MFLFRVHLHQYVHFLSDHGGNLKDNYHLPHGDDLAYWGTDLNTYFYKTKDNDGKYKPPYLTKGDFNNDGIIDRAFILFRNDKENNA